jgi:cobalt/nickel transport protein
MELALVFSHPFDNGFTMNMGKPEEFYVVAQRGEGDPKKTDLLQYLEPIEWSGVDSKAAAYVARPPRQVTRSLGDYTFVLKPAPYYEANEDKYIQQITKTVVNVGGLPGAWDEPLGPSRRDRAARQAVRELGRRRIPRRRPLGWQTRAACRDRDRVLEPRAADRASPLRPEGKVTAPQESFSTLSVRADAMGQIIIGLPKAGWWGICALNLDDGLKHEGKELSLDAVLWLKATDMVK